jgi:hypothetical protein
MYRDGLLYSLRCLSVCVSVCPHRRTYPNLVDLYIKLKVFYQEHESDGANFVQKTIKPKNQKNWFFGGFFSYFLTQMILKFVATTYELKARKF